MLARDHFHQAVCETPFHPRTSALNQLNLWHRWRDHTVADAYFDVGMEYNAIRNSCAVFDLSPMTKHLITGSDALAYMNRLVTRDVAKIKAGRVGYCLWCDDAGQVVDDGTIFHLREGVYRLCSQERQLDWLLCSALGFDVQVVEETNDVAGLAVQGPTSCAVLKQLGLEGIETMTPFALRSYRFEDTELMVSRTGYTGDLGYELWIEPNRAVLLWDRLFEAGRDHGIRAIGTLALEMSRIEAGFIQAGVDFLPADRAVRPDRTRSPFELDLGWLVDFAKPNFTGRRALLAERERGSRFRLVRLDVEGNKPAKDAYVYDPQRRNIGAVTSSMWSPAAKASIALASVRMPWGKAGEELFAEIFYQKELKWNRFMARCRVVEGAFYDPARRRLTPAPDR
jgi:glycine cleavage system T protein (aminomethyltransferase)